MKYGDTIRIEMLDGDGHSVFGAIEQRVAPLHDPAPAPAESAPAPVDETAPDARADSDTDGPAQA
jgi:fumarylacetoacetate (FAA) hydrolase